MKTALITGITGQAGAYLSHLLIERNYRVIGTTRDTRLTGKSRTWPAEAEVLSLDLSAVPGRRTSRRRRFPNFVTRKLVSTAYRIAAGEKLTLDLGHSDIQRG